MMLEENKLFHNRYLLVRLLGRGGSSEVWLAGDTLADNLPVAVKVYAPGWGVDEAGAQVFREEFSLVFNFNHTNLLRPVHLDFCDRMPYLILPYCENGPVSRLTGNATEDDIWRILRDVAAGLAYLHGRKEAVIHQDVKPDNILLNMQDTYMLTDFGISVKIRNTLRKSMSSQAFTSGGTLAYMGPERFSTNNQPVKASDVWALGATLYELMTGDSPFGNHGGMLQYNGAATPDASAKWSVTLRRAVTLCLSRETWDRPVADTLVQWADMYFNNARRELDKTVANAMANVKKKQNGNDNKKKYLSYIAAFIAAGVLIAIFARFLFPDEPNKPDKIVETLEDTIKIDDISEPIIIREPSEYEKNMAKGDTAFARRDFENARTFYKEAFNKGIAEDECKKAQERIEECDKRLSPPPDSLYRTYMQEGKRLIKKGEFQGASNAFDKAASTGNITLAEKQEAEARAGECRQNEAQIKNLLREAGKLLEPGGSDMEACEKAFDLYKQAKKLGSLDRTGYDNYRKIAEKLIKALETLGKDKARNDVNVKKLLQYAKELNNTPEINKLLKDLE
jgi:serine/threonine protein kinase